MEIFLPFFLGFLCVIGVVMIATICINRSGAQYDAEFDRGLPDTCEHECDAPYPRFYE